MSLYVVVVWFVQCMWCFMLPEQRRASMSLGPAKAPWHQSNHWSDFPRLQELHRWKSQVLETVEMEEAMDFFRKWFHSLCKWKCRWCISTVLELQWSVVQRPFRSWLIIVGKSSRQRSIRSPSPSSPKFLTWIRSTSRKPWFLSKQPEDVPFSRISSASRPRKPQTGGYVKDTYFASDKVCAVLFLMPKICLLSCEDSHNVSTISESEYTESFWASEPSVFACFFLLACRSSLAWLAWLACS